VASIGDASVVFSATAEAGPAALVETRGGNYQAAVPGAPLPHQLMARVTDSFGNPVAGATVTFTVALGEGSIADNVGVSDATGVVSSGTWTLGGAGGPQQVRAYIDGAFATFTATSCDDECQQLELAFVHAGSIRITNLLGHVRVLTSTGEDHMPAWSPDGRRLAFVRYRTDVAPPFPATLNWNAEVWIMDADGSNAARLGAGHSPSWSPDGNWIALAQGDCIHNCGVLLVSTVSPASGQSGVGHMASQPAWSPDGHRIAYVSLSGDDGYHALQVVNVDGSQVTDLVQRDNIILDHPTWSPDGERIAFAQCGPVWIEEVNSCNIFTLRADGSSPSATTLTTAGGASQPAWSPDTRWIALTFPGPENEPAIAYVDAEFGGDPIPIVSAGSSPAWRPRPNAQR
jgi:TolB protein